MSLKLNVGLSRKIGESNYGPRGASCHVEGELDTTTLSQDPARFQQRVQEAFAARRQAVEEELAQQPARGDDDRRANGSPDRHASHDQPVSSSPPRPATANQVKAIRAIAHRAGVDLASELSQRFGLRSPQALILVPSEPVNRLAQGATRRAAGRWLIRNAGRRRPFSRRHKSSNASVL